MYKKDKRLIVYDNTELEVEFYYYPEYLGTYEQPPEAAYVELIEVKTIHGVDIWELLCEEKIDEISDYILSMTECWHDD